MSLVCPLCKKEMTKESQCWGCDVYYWTSSELQKEFAIQHFTLNKAYNGHLLISGQSYFYYRKHDIFYTPSEMERIAKLKAFL